MKISRFFLFCVAPLLLAACTPSDMEDEHPRVSPREANIERYLQKAKENNSLAVERLKPLPAAGFTDPGKIKTVRPAQPSVSLPDQLHQSKTALEARVRTAYGEDAAKKAGVLILQYHQEALAAVKEAKSPDDMAQRLKELDAKQRDRLNLFLQNEQANVWLRPTQAQLLEAKEEMTRKNELMTAEISTIYGPACAEKIKPVLQETADAYLLAMAGAKDKTDLDERVSVIASKGDEQIQALIAQYGDPSGPAPEEEITAMRAQMIAAYQPMEERIEELYGKEGVLSVRPLFNQMLENASNVARTPTRVSYKKEELTRLNKVYQDKLSKMQAQFNKDVEAKRQKISPKNLMHGN